MLEKELLKIESHRVPKLLVRQRLQEYAVGIFRTIISRKGVKNAVKKGLIFINSEMGHTGDWISGGELIELFQNPQPTKPDLSLELEVLYEDDYLAVINKSAGILVSGNKRFTVENALCYNLKESLQFDTLIRPEPIHRLDYPTTGALLIGKTVSAVSALNKLFENRAISKTYVAVTIFPMDPNGLIETHIDEKPAKSEYKKLASVTSPKYGVLNLLKLQPHTGRRHQLRKHMAELGNPILGDADYAKEGFLLKGKGLYLHAFSLQFEHPFTKKALSIMATLPKKFGKLFPDV